MKPLVKYYPRVPRRKYSGHSIWLEPSTLYYGYYVGIWYYRGVMKVNKWAIKNEDMNNIHRLRAILGSYNPNIYICIPRDKTIEDCKARFNYNGNYKGFDYPVENIKI